MPKADLEVEVAAASAAMQKMAQRVPRADFTVEYPKFARNRGAGFWINPVNWVASRRKFRADYSREWRKTNEAAIPNNTLSEPLPRTRSLEYLGLFPTESKPIRIVILGDPGDGDKSQHGLLPLIRSLEPDFMILNGDVAYPSGRERDYKEGFFEPYNDLGIPIWAVPGNHEYYSPRKGAEFVEVFCGHQEELWQRFGLKFVRQPGTYWELMGTNGQPELSIIGIDSGHSGNLDTGKDSDADQMSWLKERLTEADKHARKVILLFHIPLLVNGKIDGKAKLVRLHQMIASHSCVKAVICGHEHNFQKYSDEVFRAALEKIGGVTPVGKAPVYFVSGGGGAFLAVPPDREALAKEADKAFLFEEVWPDLATWEAFTGASVGMGLWRSGWERVKNSLPIKTQAKAQLGKGGFLNDVVASARKRLAGTKFSRTGLDQMLAFMQEAEFLDPDKASYLSLLLVEIYPNTTTITPVLMPELEMIYDPKVTHVAIQNTNPLPDPKLVDQCKGKPIPL